MHSIRFSVTALGLTVILHAAQAQGVDASLMGRVYPAEAASPEPVFTVQRSTTTTGDSSVLNERFKDMQGHTVALLETTYVSGALRSIAFEQSQSKESASAIFKDGRVFFTTTDNGNTRKSDQVVEGKWVPLTAVPDEIARNWDVVTGGVPLKFAMPVPIMRDHFAFKVIRQRTWTENGKRLTEFKMEPSSMLIRMMADAFYYVFDDESRTLVEYRGLTIAKTGADGKLRDLKARIVYSPLALANPADR